MTSPSGSEPRTRSLYHALSPVQALSLVAIAVASTFLLQIVLVGAGVTGLASLVVSYIAVGISIIAYGRRRGGSDVVGLAKPRARFVLAGAMIGIATWYVGLEIVDWLKPPGDVGAIEKVVEDTALPVGVLVIALLPAVVEELIFRGVLARGLASRLPVAAAVAISAVLFSAFHIIPRQMVAVLPLGLALGYLAIRARSALPTMLAHLLNNAVVLLAARGDLDALTRIPPAALFAIAFAIAGGGVVLAATGAA